MPIAAAGARGSDAQELLIQLVMYPAAPTGIISFSLIFWGLRGSGLHENAVER
jgi:hydroxylaminobenzene mutase